MTHEQFQRVRALIEESSHGIVASWELLVWIPALIASLEDVRQLLSAGEAVYRAHRETEPGSYSRGSGQAVILFWQGATDYLSGCKGGSASSPDDCDPRNYPLEDDDGGV